MDKEEAIGEDDKENKDNKDNKEETEVSKRAESNSYSLGKKV